MNLSLKEKNEIEEIVKAFTFEDKEIICQEVERIANNYSPFINALSDYKPDENTKDAMQFISEDSADGQEMIANHFFEAIRLRVTYEHAFGVFKRRHIYEDAA